MRYRSVLLFGAPGSGKGTQGRVVGGIPGFFYVSTGDMFRALRQDDPIGRIFFDYSSRGLLVPDETTVELWTRHMQTSIAEGRFHPEHDILVLDGFPRSLAQAQMLKDKLEVKAVLHLTCSDTKVLVDRLQKRASIEKRPDDARLEVIHTRLETYESQTKPMLDFYGPPFIRPIECNQKPVCVLRDVVQVLAGL